MNKATVEVNGISYEVSYESKNTVATTAPRKPAAIPTSTTYKSSAQSTSATSNKTTYIKAPLPGTISAISVKVGSQVKTRRLSISHGSHENGKQYRGKC